MAHIAIDSAGMGRTSSPIDSDRTRWDETLRLAWQLDRQGIILPIQDLHIAACALHAGAVILTHDAHFQRIPGVDATDRIY